MQNNQTCRQLLAMLNVLEQYEDNDQINSKNVVQLALD